MFAGSVSLPAPALQQADQRVQPHGHHAQEHNRHQKPIHFKDLTGIDDQVSKAVSGSQKFSDDHAHQTKTDIYFHIADNGRDASRQHHLAKGVEAVPAQGVDKFDLSGVNSGKTGVQI